MCCCCCSDQLPVRPVFSVPLADAYRSLEYQYVPKIVVKCVAIVERNDNIGKVGIYKERADDVRIQALKSKIETKGEYESLRSENVHVVTGLLMCFFRELATNVIPVNVLDYLALELDFTRAENLPKICKCLQILDEPHYHTLKYLVKHLNTVSKHSAQNMMSTPKLAIVWSECLFRNTRSRNATQINKYQEFLGMLIERYATLFK